MQNVEVKSMRDHIPRHQNDYQMQKALFWARANEVALARKGARSLSRRVDEGAREKTWPFKILPLIWLQIES